MGSCWVLEFGGHRGSSCWGGDVLVIMQYRFQQSVPIDSGSASPSVHRESVEHRGYVTETGTHSAKLCRRTSWLHSAVLGYGVHVPVVMQRRVPGVVQTVRMFVEVPQMQFIDSRRHPVVAQKQPRWECTL